MSDYLNNIVARSLNLADVVQPRVPQLFEQSFASTPEPDSPLQTEISERPAIFSEASETPGTRTDQAESEIRPPDLEPRKSSPASIETHIKKVSPAAVQPIGPSEGVRKGLTPIAVNQAAGAADSRSVRDSVATPSATSNQNSQPQSERELPVPSTVGPLWKEATNTVSKPSLRSSAARLQQPPPNGTLSSLPQNNRSEPQSPEIRITIGRVDVRAIMPPSRPPNPAPVRPKPALSLESYLKQREEGKR